MYFLIILSERNLSWQMLVLLNCGLSVMIIANVSYCVLICIGFIFMVLIQSDKTLLASELPAAPNIQLISNMFYGIQIDYRSCFIYRFLWSNSWFPALVIMYSAKIIDPINISNGKGSKTNNNLYVDWLKRFYFKLVW